MNQVNQDTIHPDFRTLLTWIASGLLLYLLVSGALIFWLPFGVYAQYSVIVHSVAGVLALLPVAIIVVMHWRRRDASIAGKPAALAKVGVVVLAISLASGLAIVLQSVLGRQVDDVWWLAHQLSALAFGAVLFLHLLPILARYANTPSTPRRIARRWFLLAAAVLLAAPLGITSWLAGEVETVPRFQAFPDDYAWRYGEDRPFWPSRARIEGSPWEQEIRAGLTGMFGEEERERLLSSMADDSDKQAGPLDRLRQEASLMTLAEDRQQQVDRLLAAAGESMMHQGALEPEPLLGSESCGSGGCHDDIYKEWVPSAHGFAAFDPLFVDAPPSEDVAWRGQLAVAFDQLAQMRLDQRRQPADKRGCFLSRLPQHHGDRYQRQRRLRTAGPRTLFVFRAGGHGRLLESIPDSQLSAAARRDLRSRFVRGQRILRRLPQADRRPRAGHAYRAGPGTE